MSDATWASAALVPVVGTANAITVTGEAEEEGAQGNVVINTISVLTNAPATLTSVTNKGDFTGGSDPEDTEEFRARLLRHLQNPESGSPTDIQAWAEAVDGVETATVFNNDNLGTPQNGHVTVRISGPGGSIPAAGVIANVLAELIAQIPAIMIPHVTTFTALPTNVTCDVTTSGTYTLGDVTPSVQNAIAAYINSLAVGQTLMIAGIVDAIFGLPGISDVTVSVPATNQTTTATQKRTPGTLTVT
jgi:uncharacterized phage protein gp47/JayE